MNGISIDICPCHYNIRMGKIAIQRLSQCIIAIRSCYHLTSFVLNDTTNTDKQEC